MKLNDGILLTNDNHADGSDGLQHASLLDEHAVAARHDGDATAHLLGVGRLHAARRWLHSHHLLQHTCLLLQVGAELGGTGREDEAAEEGVGHELHDVWVGQKLVRLRVGDFDHLLHEGEAMLRQLIACRLQVNESYKKH